MRRNVDTRTIWDPSAVAWSRGPRILELKRRDAEHVLSRNHVGRCAFVGDGRVELFPLHYVYRDGVIIGRTSLGLKYATWLTRDELVFEVDESNGLFDWRSVIVRGRVTVLHARGSDAERRAFEDAVSAFRTLVPDAFTLRDPTPQRAIAFVMTPHEITGRQATMT